MKANNRRYVDKVPSDLTITAREVHFDYEKRLRENRYWHSNDPVITHFFNALQSTFPEGERHFIDSARDVRDWVGKENLPPKLLKEIQLFIKQEAFHGREHDDWTKALAATGFPRMEEFNEELEKLRLWGNEHVSPMVRLAATAATEHYTASLAHLFLYKKPEMLEGASEPFKELLVYHALEELEHKSVCYDLYQFAGGGYVKRLLGLIFSTLDMMRLIRARHIYLLKKDGLWNKQTRKQTRQMIWGSQGLVIALLPYVLRYSKPSFHPWEVDERKDFMERFGDLINRLPLMSISR